jgi:quercetin dioxygenase-like cupin family protein
MKLILSLALLALLVGRADAQVMDKVLPPLPPNQEMLVLEVTLAPGQVGTPHRHNAHTFVYVLEGRVQMAVAGGETLTLGPGEMFYESPDDVHAVSSNASRTEPAKILVHMLKTAGAPVSVPVSQE